MMQLLQPAPARAAAHDDDDDDVAVRRRLLAGFAAAAAARLQKGCPRVVVLRACCSEMAVELVVVVA